MTNPNVTLPRSVVETAADFIDASLAEPPQPDARVVEALTSAPDPQPAVATEIERLQAECDAITELNHAQWLTLQDVRAAVIEECARVCDERAEKLAPDVNNDFNAGVKRGLEFCALAIRALARTAGGVV